MRDFESAMINGFCESKFLVPVNESEIQLEERGNVPVFSDEVEMEKVFKKSEGYEAIVWQAKDLIQAPADCVINVGSIGFLMRRGLAKQMFVIYEKETNV